MMRARRQAEGVVTASRLLFTSLSCGAALLATSCSQRPATSIRSAPPAERNALLLQAIRDAGYLCDEVIDATAPAQANTGWRVLCTDTLVYVASLDAQDVLHIEPIPYGDPATPLPVSRDPDTEGETVRPDP
jgi:hypothetical protein